MEGDSGSVVVPRADVQKVRCLCVISEAILDIIGFCILSVTFIRAVQVDGSIDFVYAPTCYKQN
jgi:hypothetical protein